MSEATALVQPQIARRCPACGRVSADSERCLHCWRDIAAVAPLPADEAESARKVEAALARRYEEGWLTPGRVWRYGSLVVVAVLLVGWWAYGAFIDKPPRPDAPSSTARSATAGAWTTQDGDNRGTRSTPASAHLGGSEAWRVALGSPAATALVTDGRLLVAALHDGRLVGLDASSGKTLWTAVLNNPPLSAPVIAGDRVYLAQREGLIVVLNASDGKEVWHSRFVARSVVEASPLVADGVVYAYSPDGLFAFDAEDGRILWEQVFDVGRATVAPVVEGKHLVIITVNKAIVFDRTNGQRTYYLTFARSQPSSVAVRDSEVLAVYGRDATMFHTASRRPWWDGLANISLGGGTVRGAWFRLYLYGMAPAVPPQAFVWDVTVPPKRTMAAAMGQDIVVVTSPDGAVTALGRVDGNPVWTAKTDLLVAAPIVTADGVLFAEEDRLLLLDPVTGQQRAERTVGGLLGVTPAEAATYVTTATGDVIALR